MILFRSCCCCVSLRTGCIVIGILTLLCSLSLLLLQNDDLQPSNPFAYSISIVSSIVLIGGAVGRNHFCLWIKIFYNSLAITLGLREFSYQMVAAAQANESAMMILLLGGVFFIVVAFAVYLTLVIYSYVCELREEEEYQHKYLKNVPPPANNFGQIA